MNRRDFLRGLLATAAVVPVASTVIAPGEPEWLVVGERNGVIQMEWTQAGRLTETIFGKLLEVVGPPPKNQPDWSAAIKMANTWISNEHPNKVTLYPDNPG